MVSWDGAAPWLHAERLDFGHGAKRRRADPGGGLDRTLIAEPLRRERFISRVVPEGAAGLVVSRSCGRAIA
jgi:hypothetical protein